jgi:pimeloyl-ACP methyl ester carboxylesterase
MHPRLFHSVILLDPVMGFVNSGIGPAVASTSRRDIWESRAAAAAKFAQSKFYQAWDPRVLDLWIEHGLRELPTELYPILSSASLANSNSKGQAELGTRKEDKPVTLTTTKHQELFTYLRPTYRRPDAYPVPDMDPAYDVVNPRGYPFYRPEPFHVFRRLPELRPSVLYVFGGQSDISTPELRRAKMQSTGTGVGGSGGVDKGRVEEVVLDCGHLVAMEKVGECAEAMAGFLEREVGRWRTQRDAVEAARKGRERREVIMVDERWKEEIKPRGKGKGEAKL